MRQHTAARCARILIAAFTVATPVAALTPTPTLPPALSLNAIPNPARETHTVTLTANRAAPGAMPQWSQLDGPAVALEGANTLQATFVAPQVTQATTLVFRYALPPLIEYRDLAVLVLPSNGVTTAIVGDVGPPGGLITASVSLDPVALPVARLRQQFAFAPEASVRDRGDGTPDCAGAADVTAASFAFLPPGCTATGSCTQVSADLSFAAPRTADGLAYGCTVSITGDPADSCTHPLTCADGDAVADDGARLHVSCTDGLVTSRFPPAEPEFGLHTEPASPRVGDDVRLIFSVSFAGGLAQYSLSGLYPLLDGGSLVPEVSSGQVIYTARALRAGTAVLQLTFDYETVGGCPGNEFFYFRYTSSPPLPLLIEDPNGVRIGGRVAEFPGCQGAMRDVEVQLEPGHFSTRTDLVAGEFSFTGVSPGDYAIAVVPACNPFGCWKVRDVHVGNEDLSLTLCPLTFTCVGDCNDDRRVTIDELIRGVAIVLGNPGVAGCAALDADHDGEVRIEELITAVNVALDGCYGADNVTPSPSPTPTPAP